MDTIKLVQFENIDSALNALNYMGDFETCEDPRAWNRAFNRLLDYCLDAGMDWDAPCPIEWGSRVVLEGLLGKIEVIDELL